MRFVMNKKLTVRVYYVYRISQRSHVKTEQESKVVSSLAKSLQGDIEKSLRDKLFILSTKVC